MTNDKIEAHKEINMDGEKMRISKQRSLLTDVVRHDKKCAKRSMPNCIVWIAQKVDGKSTVNLSVLQRNVLTNFLLEIV